MSRELKVRAWDRDLEIMVYSDKRNKSTYDINYEFAMNEKGVLVCNWHEDTEDYYGNFKEANGTLDNLMQYTGLKDKNGKEIYEKDIVKVTINNETFNAWIVFEMGSFMIANNDMSFYFEDNWNDNVKCLSELAWNQEEFEDRIYCLEVIGDTYQNIDLIEV